MFKITLTSADAIYGWDGLVLSLEKLSSISDSIGVIVASGTLTDGALKVLYVCLADGSYLLRVFGTRTSTFALGWTISQSANYPTTLLTISGSDQNQAKITIAGGSFVQVHSYFSHSLLFIQA